MNVQDIQTRVQGGERVEIFYVDRVRPYLFTGFANKVTVNSEGVFVDLDPYVALYLLNARGDAELGIFGSHDESKRGYSGLVLQGGAYSPATVSINTRMTAHKRNASQLLKKLHSTDDLPSFKRYLELAHGLRAA